MARSWSVHQRIDIGSSAPLDNKAIADTGLTKVYIPTAAGKVFEYDGSSVTDISGATFTSGTIHDICNFKGTIYVAYENASGVARVAKWNGGTWTDVYSPTNIGLPAISDGRRLLGADADRMVLTVTDLVSPFETYWMASTDGSTWNRQTVGGSTITLVRQIDQNLGSVSDGNNYGELLAEYNPSSFVAKTCKHDTGNDWDELTATGYNSPQDVNLVGYFDGKSFYVDWNGSNRDLKYSTDWGDSLSASGAPTTPNVGQIDHFLTYIAASAMMLNIAGSNTAYTWNDGTSQFDSDGTCGSNDDIHRYFRLGSTIYAICDDVDVGTNDLAIYEGGLVGRTYGLRHSAGGIPGAII